MDIRYHTKAFYELSLDELYAIMVLRQEVFIVEQDCPYQDADGKDQESMHMMAVNQHDELLAYIRILPKGISYPNYSSIGRVVNSEKVRGHGVGKKIMTEALSYMKTNYPSDNIKISAQCYLLGFYENLGFIKVGEEYLEDDIPHHAMILEINEQAS